MKNPNEPRHPGTGVNGYLSGLTYPWRGIRWLATHRQVWPYALMPAVVNGLIVLVIGVVALQQYDALFAWVQPDALKVFPDALPWWKTFWRPVANGLLGVVLSILLVGASVLGGVLSGAILAGPFHEKLSEVVESVATGSPPPDEPLSFRTLSQDAYRAVASAVQRFSLFLTFYIPLLLISFIPFVGLVGVLGTLVYSAFFLAMNFTDPALERRKFSLRKKLGWAQASLVPWMGFGTSLLVLMLIPLVGLVLAPAFVTAGTLLWLDVGSSTETSSEPP
jgi:CysZ protein